ncbi:MAG: AIR carboxylase family protein, partial [Paracoccaceae bacterium]
AAKTIVPVLGVPVKGWAFDGLDSLHSIVQMPRGIPVATFAVGPAGAMNAGLFAAALLATTDTALAQRLSDWRDARTAAVAEEPTRD